MQHLQPAEAMMASPLALCRWAAMIRALLLLEVLTLAVSGFAADPAHQLSVFVDNLGNANDAPFIRERLISALAKTSTITIVDSPQKAHALLTGSGRSIQGEHFGSDVFGSSGGTVELSELALQLKDSAGTIIWAFDSASCGRRKLTRIPNDAVTCAAKELEKVTGKDHRLSDSALPRTLPAAGFQENAGAAEVAAALKIATERHPDLRQYEKEMERIAEKLPHGTMTLNEYIEALYVLAKEAAISQR